MMDNRPAEISAELLQHIERPGNSICLVDGIIRVTDAGVAVVIEGVTMKRISPRFGYSIDETCPRASISGVIGIVGHLKFLDRLLTKDVRHASSPAGVAKIIAGRIGSVYSERIGAVAVGVAGVAPALLTGHAYQPEISIRGRVRSEQHEVGVAAAAQG